MQEFRFLGGRLIYLLNNMYFPMKKNTILKKAPDDVDLQADVICGWLRPI